MKIIYLFVFVTLGLFTQSCTLHRSEARYKKFKYDQIKSIDFHYSDSVNGPLKFKIAISSYDFKNDDSVASLIRETLATTKKYKFEGSDSANAYLKSTDTIKYHLVLRILRDKDILLIWPYQNTMTFFSRKGSGFINIGKAKIGNYASTAICQDAYFSNKYINLVNRIIEYENNKPSLDSSGKSKKPIELLPLIKE